MQQKISNFRYVSSEYFLSKGQKTAVGALYDQSCELDGHDCRVNYFEQGKLAANKINYPAVRMMRRHSEYLGVMNRIYEHTQGQHVHHHPVKPESHPPPPRLFGSGRRLTTFGLYIQLFRKMDPNPTPD